MNVPLKVVLGAIAAVAGPGVLRPWQNNGFQNSGLLSAYPDPERKSLAAGDKPVT